LPTLKRLAYLLCGDEHRADDLVQESVTKLYMRWAAASKAGNLDSYVRSIVVRSYIDEVRRPWSRVRLFGAPPEPRRPESSAIENKLLLHTALATLPARQRAVVVLRFLCDLSVEDAADVMGCSQGTVKSQTVHGLAKLRQILTDRDLVLTPKEK
jgi:RNA polymerase sigma-70 factor (sigma-E family)